MSRGPNAPVGTPGGNSPDVQRSHPAQYPYSSRHSVTYGFTSGTSHTWCLCAGGPCCLASTGPPHLLHSPGFTSSTFSSGSNCLWCASCPACPPGLRPVPLRFFSRCRLLVGLSVEGGLSELLESRPSRASNSSTAARNSARVARASDSSRLKAAMVAWSSACRASNHASRASLVSTSPMRFYCTTSPVMSTPACSPERLLPRSPTSQSRERVQFLFRESSAASKRRQALQ